MKNCGLQCIEYLCIEKSVDYSLLKRFDVDKEISMKELLEALQEVEIEAYAYKMEIKIIEKPYILHLQYKNWKHYILILKENYLFYYIFDGSKSVYFIPKLLIKSLSTNRVITLKKY